eukprot:364929-Chlamydomonas_euryale.AAC.2
MLRPQCPVLPYTTPCPPTLSSHTPATSAADATQRCAGTAARPAVAQPSALHVRLNQMLVRAKIG